MPEGAKKCEMKRDQTFLETGAEVAPRKTRQPPIKHHLSLANIVVLLCACCRHVRYRMHAENRPRHRKRSMQMRRHKMEYKERTQPLYVPSARLYHTMSDQKCLRYAWCLSYPMT